MHSIGPSDDILHIIRWVGSAQLIRKANANVNASKTIFKKDISDVLDVTVTNLEIFLQVCFVRRPFIKIIQRFI